MAIVISSQIRRTESPDITAAQETPDITQVQDAEQPSGGCCGRLSLAKRAKCVACYAICGVPVGLLALVGLAYQFCDRSCSSSRSSSFNTSVTLAPHEDFATLSDAALRVLKRKESDGAFSFTGINSGSRQISVDSDGS